MDFTRFCQACRRGGVFLEKERETTRQGDREREREGPLRL